MKNLFLVVRYFYPPTTIKNVIIAPVTLPPLPNILTSKLHLPQETTQPPKNPPKNPPPLHSSPISRLPITPHTLKIILGGVDRCIK